MDYKRILLLAFALCYSILLLATDVEGFYLQVRSKFDSVMTLQADVAQTNEFIQAKTKLLSSGKLYYKPGNLLIDYTKPNIQKLIIKGNTVVIYDKESKTLIKTTNSGGISNPLQMVDKYWSTSKKELISDDSLAIGVRLMPPKNDNLKKLEVTFNQSSFMISELVYWDNSGNKVRFRFLNIQTGVVIPVSKWNFTAPSGVKVIQQ